jgi:tetratricopeptide (TPR) repeat protein
VVLKKDSWLVRGLLFLAVAAFVAPLVMFSFDGNGAKGGANPAAAPAAADQTAKLQGTIDGYNAVLAREPNNQTALLGIIEAKIALKDLEGTVEPLEKLANLNPNAPEYSIALAQTKQQLKDLEGAAQIYRRVLTQNPGNMLALEGLVDLLISQDRYEAATGLLRDTLATADQTNELSPASVDKLGLKLLLGKVFAGQKNFDEALKMYDEAIADAKTASPTQPDFRPTLAKGLVLQEKGDAKAAQALFDEALALAPTQYKDGVKQLIAQKTAPATPSGNAATPGATPAEGDQKSDTAPNDAAENAEEATPEAPVAPSAP